MAEHLDDQIGRAPRTSLAQDVLSVDPNRTHRQIQFSGDFLALWPIQEAIEHLLLAVGERRGTGVLHALF